MNVPHTHYPRRNHLVIAGLLTLGGIATGLIYVLHSSPYTMVLFLGVGQGMFLGGIALFVYAQIRDVRARLESIETRRFAEGEVICRQSDPAESIFVVCSGEVEFIRTQPDGAEVVLGRLGPEESFGEFCVLGDMPYLATGRAVTEVELLSVHRSDFEKMYQNVPSMRKRIDAQVSQRKKLIR